MYINKRRKIMSELRDQSEYWHTWIVPILVILVPIHPWWCLFYDTLTCICGYYRWIWWWGWERVVVRTGWLFNAIDKISFPTIRVRVSCMLITLNHISHKPTCLQKYHEICIPYCLYVSRYSQLLHWLTSSFGFEISIAHHYCLEWKTL